VIELEAARVAEQRLQIRGGIIAAAPEADEMFVSLPIGQLDQAEPVAARNEAHGFGIYRDRTDREAYAGGQVFFVKMDRHSRSLYLLS